MYDRLDISITERGESFYQSRMEGVVRDLTSKGMLEEDEGRKVSLNLILAAIFTVDLLSRPQVMFGPGAAIPLTVVKSDGGFTYDTSDMAALRCTIVACVGAPCRAMAPVTKPQGHRRVWKVPASGIFRGYVGNFFRRTFYLQ